MKSLFFWSLLFLCMLNTSIAKAESSSEPNYTDQVSLVVYEDEALAFSGPRNEWVNIAIKPNEMLRRKMAHGNIAMVVTDRRILAFSVKKHRWIELSIAYNENIKDVKLSGDVATILTDRRAIGFSAEHGKWVIYE